MTDVQFNTLWYNRRLGTSLSKMTRQHEVQVVPPHEEEKREEMSEKFCVISNRKAELGLGWDIAGWKKRLIFGSR